jgi:V/A-type H+-transporting ATPase subunit B
MSLVGRTYLGAAGATGALLFLRNARRVALGEWASISMPGQPVRRGQVIDAGDDVTVVQILDDTLGLAPAEAAIALRGEVAVTAVGRELLGRAFNGIGSPIDGLPAPVGERIMPVAGAPMNPQRRLRPSDLIETGVSAIDGLNTLVRGQKLPVFSGPGLPGLDLAAQVVEGARAPRGEAFAVVFVGMGITARERRRFLDRLSASGAMDRTVVYLNEMRDPSVERLLAPRVGLTVAEFLAFDAGLHVLVVMADLTNYCDALREVATAREEVPGRRGYPGYMYTDLATLLERAGILDNRPGSVTQLPILTMPDDDITHPIPDLTGYITEGQLVLSRELFQRGITPPIDVLPSLSRLMNAGIGPGRTTPEHREWANQLYASYAQGREARLMAAIVGDAGLSDSDRRALGFADRFEREFIHHVGRRSLAETLEAGWMLLESLPQDDLLRIRETTWAARAASRGSKEPAA